jgi:hypothetical protein
MVDKEMMRVCKPGPVQSAPAYRTALPLIRHDCIDYAGIWPLARTCGPHALACGAHFFASYGRLWRRGACTGCRIESADAGRRRWVLDAAQRHVLWFCDTNWQYSALPSAVCAGDKTGEFTVGLCNPGAYRSGEANHISIESSEVRPRHGNGPHGSVGRCSYIVAWSVARQGPWVVSSPSSVTCYTVRGHPLENVNACLCN